MDSISIGAGIIGLVAGIKKQFPQVTGVYAWLVAVALGAIAGYFKIGVDSVQAGVVVGLASSGVFETAKRVGGV